MRYPLVKGENAVETGVEIENAGANRHISRGVTERAQRALTAAEAKYRAKKSIFALEAIGRAPL
jgi:hypothetical protein